jgi:membrane carboxypeptidase/penicillin-binding protein
MALPSEIIRRRRSRIPARRMQGATPHFGWTLLVVILAGAGILGALGFEEIARELPSVEEMETVFGTGEELSFQPLRIYDRDRQVVLFEALNPAAETSRWQRVASGNASLPTHALQATLAAVDETFWENPGYQSHSLLQSMTGGSSGGRRNPANTLTQRLVEAQLLAQPGEGSIPFVRHARSVLLAAELNQRYDKSQILEWYLNSADYGRLAYGIDAAALVYFDKHAADLTLAESAMLGGFLQRKTDDPLMDLSQALENQRQVLNRMLELEWITPQQAREARAERVDRALENVPDLAMPAYAELILERINEEMPENTLGRSGLRVVSTLDYDLQLQAECTARNHLSRLEGGPVGAFQPAVDGSVCIAAGLLPPPRPQDSDFDHNLSAAGVVVIDPQNGEILSLIGPVAEPHTVGSAFYPLTYLSAFSTGYAPGSMILDIPIEASGGEDLTAYLGPVRMRTALANGLEAASMRTTRLVGSERIVRTARSMGLSAFLRLNGLGQEQLSAGDVGLSLLDLSAAFAILAHEGRMVGVETPREISASEAAALEPAIIEYIEDGSGRLLFRSERATRAVLSRELAYLVTDVLSDEPIRWPIYGPTNVLEIGRPAAAIVGRTRDNTCNWTLGYTPSRVVGVWVGNTESEAMVGIRDLNGAAPIWHAVLRYATREQPSSGWAMPAGLTEVDICDPSGLLPTAYCPVVVEEVFIQGTEPIHEDNLFRPFLVNRETGKLATLATPINLVEERIYMIPPPEAVQWAQQTGVAQPPDEYDTIYERAVVDPAVQIESPESFEVIRGEVSVLGSAEPEDFAYYRLQFGQGLNPNSWVQVGEDRAQARSGGLLGRWSTDGFNGLFTLQLVVVKESGQVITDEVFVTLDNQPPTLEILTPRNGQRVALADQELIIEARASDSTSVHRVTFSINGEILGTMTSPPYAFHWPLQEIGEFEIQVSAVDQPGNRATTDPITIQVTP